MSAKKQEDDEAVFDDGGFGIGHNHGPPLDDPEIIADADAEAEANADTDTQTPVSGSKLTPEALTWLRAREKSGELAKVIWDSPYGSDVIKHHEMRMQGPSRRDPASGGDCKWRNPDGLLSRGGYRRIIPAWLDGDGRENELWADNAQQLAELAKQELGGRNLAVFEALVIKPLLEGRRCTTEERQQQAFKYGVHEKRIYKILDRCRKKLDGAGDKLKPEGFSEEERAQRWQEYKAELDANKQRLKAAAQKADTTMDHGYLYYGGCAPGKDAK